MSKRLERIRLSEERMRLIRDRQFKEMLKIVRLQNKTFTTATEQDIYQEDQIANELEKAAVIWAKDLNDNTVQFCDSHGSRSEEAFIQKCTLSFEMGAMFERKRILEEAEKRKVEADFSTTFYHVSPEEVVKIDDLKEICGGKE